MNKNITTPEEGLQVLYDSGNPMIQEWLKKVHEASQGTGSAPDMKNALEMAAKKIDRLKSAGFTRQEIHALNGDGGIGILGEIMAVRATLENMLASGSIPENALGKFTILARNLRYPIPLTETPNCPIRPEYKKNPVSYFPSTMDNKHMPILIGAVHEVRNCGIYKSVVPCDYQAPMPTAFSTPLNHDLSTSIATYLRKADPEMQVPDFSVKEGGGHWRNEKLIERGRLDQWLTKLLAS